MGNTDYAKGMQTIQGRLSKGKYRICKGNADYPRGMKTMLNVIKGISEQTFRNTNTNELIYAHIIIVSMLRNDLLNP